MTGRPVTVLELGQLIADKQLQVGYSQSTDRAYVDLDGEIVYAVLGRAPLPSWTPGFNAIAEARNAVFFAQIEQERQDEWDRASPEQRELIQAFRKRMAETPDPPAWQMERELERRGRL